MENLRYHGYFWAKLSLGQNLQRGIAGALMGALCAGCGAAPDEENVSEQVEQIEGGKLETGYTGVGYTGCSAVLITPSLALTANHCGNASGFATGNDYRVDFQWHGVDAQISMPFNDLKLIHLSTPASDAQILSINAGAYPEIGDTCTAVGFGTFHETANSWYSGVKRSATVAIRAGGQSANDPRIYARWVTGGTNHGDSGGPLLCDGKIVGVLSSGTNYPYNTDTARFSYTPVYPEWVLENIGIVPPAVTGSLYATNDESLFRIAKTVGNSVEITDPAADWSGAQAMASLNGTIYVIQSGYLTAVDPASGSFNVIGGQDWPGSVSLAVLNGVLYASQGKGIWRFTNLATGAYQRVGGIDWTGVTSMVGIDSTNRLYAIKNSKLYYVTTGGSAAQYTGMAWVGPASMAVIGDKIYLINGHGIWRINVTGTISYARVGTENWDGSTSLTALNGQLYLIGNGYLHRVDPMTGDYRVLGRKNWGGNVVMAALP